MAKRAAWLKPFWWCFRLCFRLPCKLRASAFRWARRFRSCAAFGLLRGKRSCSRAAFGFRRRERFFSAASTCWRDYFGAGCLTSPQQGAPPDRKKRHSIRLLTAGLVTPLFAAGELVVLPKRAAWSRVEVLNWLSRSPQSFALFVPQRFLVSAVLSCSVRSLQVLVAHYLRWLRVSVPARFRCALCLVRSRVSCARRFLQVLASSVSSLSVPQSVLFLLASTCSVQRWFPFWFSGAKRRRVTSVFSRPKFARKSPTNSRTRRCTRPQKAAFNSSSHRQFGTPLFAAGELGVVH